MKVHLCGSGHCPKVVSTEKEILIGENGNLARLKPEEWNSLVDKIRNGELERV